MTFPWTDYLELADALLTNRGTFAQEEACCRSSISRAYYAVFCAARNHAIAVEGLQLRGTGADHLDVQRHFEQASSRDHKTLGRLLSLLRRARNRADYDDEMPQVDRQAQQAIGRARRAMAILNAIPSSPSPPQQPAGSARSNA